MNKIQRTALKTELQKIDYDNLNEQETIDALSEDSGTFAETLVTNRTLLNRLDTTEAADILEALEAAGSIIPAVKWAMRSITNEGIDIGNTSTRLMLDALATPVLGDVLTASNVTNIKALSPALTIYESIGVSLPTIGDIQKAREV